MGGSRRRLQHVDDPETAFAAANHSAGSGFLGHWISAKPFWSFPGCPTWAWAPSLRHRNGGLC